MLYAPLQPVTVIGAANGCFHNLKTKPYMISDKKLNTIQKICDAATSGPWSRGGVFYPDSKSPTVDVWGPRERPEHQSGSIVASNVSIADGVFIVEAKTYMPELIAEIRELKKQLLENSSK